MEPASVSIEPVYVHIVFLCLARVDMVQKLGLCCPKPPYPELNLWVADGRCKCFVSHKKLLVSSASELHVYHFHAKLLLSAKDAHCIHDALICSLWTFIR